MTQLSSIAVVLCCLAVVSADAADKKPTVSEKEVFKVEGRPAFVILPTKPKAAGRTPWVWYAPTLPKKLPRG